MKSIAVCGAANLDILARPVSSRVFETGTLPAETIRMHPGGDAMNEATVLSLLGGNVTLYTVLGKDMAGDTIRTWCREHDIRLQEAEHHEPTSVNLVLVQEDGERCFINCPSTSMRQLKKADLLSVKEDIVCLASLFVSHALSLPETAELMKDWKQQGKITAMDTTTAKHGERIPDLADILPQVDLLFTNLRETRSFTGLEDPEEILRALQEAGSRMVLLKEGKQGVHVLRDGDIRFYAAVPNPACQDTTGCGDSFAAGFLLGLSQDRDFLSCLKLAMQCGSLACEETGSTLAFEPEENRRRLASIPVSF